MVYLVRDRWRGGLHAMKLIEKAFILESDRQTIIENERWVLGEIHSRFTTPLRFSFETKNHFVFVVECKDVGM